MMPAPPLPDGQHRTMTKPDPATPAHILIVDDDREIRDLLTQALRNWGYAVSGAANAAAMDHVLLTETVNLILLDVMMPGEDGITACRRLTQQAAPPIVMLSALGEEQDRILGLELGASHYLAKPCSAREVLATVRAALRSRVVPDTSGTRFHRFNGWRMDMLAHELFDPEGTLIDLTDGEFAVLRVFVERLRRVLSRDQLLAASRGPSSDAFDRAVDVQISRLRRKLRSTGDEMIRTIRNEGYLFAPLVTRQ
jgi:two-component system OmpR family response regulator